MWLTLGQSLGRPVVGSEGSVDHTVWSLCVLSVGWRLEMHDQTGMVSPNELQTGGGQSPALLWLKRGDMVTTLGYLVLRKAEMPVAHATSQNPPVLKLPILQRKTLRLRTDCHATQS